MTVARNPQQNPWRARLAAMLMVLFLTIFLTSSVQAETGAKGGEESTPSGAALQAASWIITVPYGALKVGFALLGGIVGGFTYVLSAGDTEAAKSVWTSTMYGTYVITPAHLKGEKAVRFLGSQPGGRDAGKSHEE